MTTLRDEVDLGDALRALAGPHRLVLVRALAQRERCVRDLVAETGLAQPLLPRSAPSRRARCTSVDMDPR